MLHYPSFQYSNIPIGAKPLSSDQEILADPDIAGIIIAVNTSQLFPKKGITLLTYQHTIANETYCSGIGLHNGLKVNLTIKPAPVNTGIIFTRTDLPGKPSIPGHYSYITDTTLATTLGVKGATVSTVEHLMAAFIGMGIDNAGVEIDGPEIPSLDGSAAPFVLMLEKAKPVRQKAKRAYIKILKPIQVRCEDKALSIYPDNYLKITYNIDFDHPLVQQQAYNMTLSEETFCQEISNARTFGFLYEVQNLKKNGFALGGSLDNAIVIDDCSVLNEGGLRFEDEFVRHKILDLLGDIALLGKPVLGHIIAHKSGHTLHHRLLQKMAIQTERWVVGYETPEQQKPQTGMGYVNLAASAAQL